jgi:hypothetical protein
MGGSSPECGGCPDGSRPLAALLQGINPSERCTTTMGVDAYDLTLGFTTTLLDAVPEACG